MKFLIDAQLPPSLKQVFANYGLDCLHTGDLDLKNETPDHIINQLSIAEKRVVVTKDSDFFDSFLLKKQPYKLVLVKFGNASKKEVLNFFSENLQSILQRLDTEDFLLLKKE